MDKGRNWPPPSLETVTPDDIEADLETTEPELLQQFRRLPKELWARHYRVVERIAAEAEDDAPVADLRVGYMVAILEQREKAIIEYSISDERLKEIWADIPNVQERLREVLYEAFVAEENLLGAGKTARVKSTEVEGVEESIAVKYLLTPTEKTLSVDAEHDMLREVETMTEIEEAEARKGVGNRVCVPHPYFFYKRGKLQCYGMEEVDGVTLDAIVNSENKDIKLQDEILEALRRRYASEEEQEALWKEVDEFVVAMHEVCLHGDMKDKNIMVDKDGRFYLIDFGQSVPMRTESEDTRSQFDNLRDDERAAMLDRVRNIVFIALNKANKEAA